MGTSGAITFKVDKAYRLRGDKPAGDPVAAHVSSDVRVRALGRREPVEVTPPADIAARLQRVLVVATGDVSHDKCSREQYRTAADRAAYALPA